ncbi:serine/threonine-protein kinase [Actinosynnema sp. NPDC023794]
MTTARVWRVGEVVDGRYEVLRVHASGGMGLVYRVRHLEWGTDLAVKCPRPELFETQAQRALFVDEARVWVDLGLHPNVCGCHYVRDLDGLPGVFAEYVPGGSLRDWIDDRRLYAGPGAPARMLDIAVQFAWGLAHAHDRGYVHQDVKPGNVLLDTTPAGVVAKVTDFGLARARFIATAPGAADPAVSIAVPSGGLTPAYASPEQDRGLPVGKSTDVYSYAVSVLEMFTGGVRWPLGRDAGAELDKLREQPVPGIPAPPRELADLLARALSHNPDARPDTMTGLAAELTRIYQDTTGTPHPRPVPVAADLRADELNNRGVSLLDLKLTADAAAAFADALAADPQHLHATYNASLLRWRQGELTDEDVIAALDATTASGADPGEAARLRAEVLRERGDRTPAPGADPVSGARAIPWYDDREREPAYDPDFDMVVKPATPSVQARFTADGTRAVTVSEGVLRVWDVHDGRLLSATPGPYRPEEETVKLGISADGGHAVTAGLYTVRFWDLARGRLLREFDAAFDGVHDGLDRVLHWPNSVCLSGDGRVAVAAFHGGIVLAWDFPSGALRQVLRGHGPRTTAAVSHDGRFLLTSDYVDGTARLWEVATGRCVRSLDAGERVNDVWLSADGQHALVAGDGEIRLWEDHERNRTLHGVGRLPSAAVYGGFVVSTDVDDTVRLWSLDDGRCLRTFRGTGSKVLAVHFDTASGLLRSAWRDNTLRWWTVPPRHTAPHRLSKPREHAELRLHDAHATDLANRARRADDPSARLRLLSEARTVPGHERDPRLLAAWRELGRTAVRTGVRGAWPARDIDVGSGQHAMAVSGDGRTVATSGVGGTVRAWHVAEGTVARLDEDRPNLVRSVTISEDGTRVLYTYGGGIRAWSTGTGERSVVLDDPRLLGMSAFDRTGRSVLVARHDAIRLWNLDNGACERELPGPHERINAVWLGETLAVATGADRAVRVWHLTTGQHVHTLHGHTDLVLSVCLSPDDRYLLSAGGYTDHTIRLWDLTTGECLRVFGDDPDNPRGVGSAPKVPSKTVRFSPDGRFAISGGSDTAVRIWDLATGACLQDLEGHRTGVNAVAFGPHADFALSAGSDGTVRRWELDWDLKIG